MSGRARGRSRGRARGDQQQLPDVRRPGEDQQPPEEGASRSRGRGRGDQQQPPPDVRRSGDSQQPPAQEEGASAMPSGRASYRGGTREPRPGAGEPVRALTGSLAELQVGTQPAAGVGDRRRDFRYSDPHTRPAHIEDKRGTTGNPISVITNFFKLGQQGIKGNGIVAGHLYQYHVQFNPEVDSKKIRIALLSEHGNLLGGVRAFDGIMLFLPHRLANEETEVFGVRTYDGERIRITITLVKELPPRSPQTIQILNIIFRRLLNKLDMVLIGRYFYYRERKIPIPQHRMELMPGFITAIRQYETNVLLGADITHKILRSNTVLELMYEMYARDEDRFQDNCSRKLIGSTVLTRYNNKMYRIDDIDWNARPSDTFKTRDSNISFVEYYKKAYNKEVGDKEQPLLVHRLKKREIKAGQTGVILLLPEFCYLTGLSDEARTDFSIMRDLAVHTRIPPRGRADTLRNFISDINSNPEAKAEMDGWNLKIDKELLKITARTNPGELVYQKGQTKIMFRPAAAEWSKEMRDKQVITAVNLRNWILIYTRRDEATVSNFLSALRRVAQPMGIQIDQPALHQLPDDRNQTYIKCLREKIVPSTQLALCVLPSNKKDRYDVIKTVCCVEKPVPSQVVVSRTISKPQMLMSVATKIAIQLNCKLGGEIWACDIPLKGMMVIGIDTYHDSLTKGRSVGGVVASLNKNCTRYYSRVTFQSPQQELLDGLEVCLHGALRKYHEVNGANPARIVVFRDGVGDGDLPTVTEHEVPQIQKSLKKIGNDYAPQLTVIVVKKRINTRFFADVNGQLVNPPPGTFVDTEVTQPESYDFFLVSQAVRQGTVTPTHYNVIWDTSQLKPDHIQRLTYKMCHLYYNWPGTIRVPAPCQYAHKLAYLVGQSIHREPDMSLADKLFYL